MSKRVEINIPVQAENEAISWAVPQLVSHNIHKTIVESDAKSNCKGPNIAQKDYRAVEVTEKKEVPAAMWVVSAEPNFDQTENKISASKEIKGPAEAVATAREPHDSPMPKEVRKEWTCDICQLTTQSEKNLKFTPSRKETQGRLRGIQSKEPAKHGLRFNCKEN
ncbi:uncharacterized protein LOC115979174 [Quercus lobata]|uniref:uncharacterized protein LOC115979174 n=1 Tax=Quercus lobata TaxID=97700 RepID=UPI001245E948|nr:uncharacterized protein LOC115979174 [Quercus lobata]